MEGNDSEEKELVAEQQEFSPTDELQKPTPNSNKFISISTYISVIVFGLSSWIVINGIFSQYNIFVLELPEKYEIATDMALVIQISNIFPFGFFLLHLFFNRTPKQNLLFFLYMDTVTIFFLLVLGILACVAMAYCWNIIINGMSIPFLILVFIVGAIDCTTSVIYWSFISHFHPNYSIALSIGESATGLITSIIGLIQQPGSHSLFPFWIFCILLIVILSFSLFAFVLLRFVWYKYESIDKETSLPTNNNSITLQQSVFVRFVLLQGMISFFQNGILISITSFVLIYYPFSEELIRYSVLISQFVDPICCWLAYCIPFYSNWIASLLHISWFLISSILFFIALQNPTPPWQQHLFMGIVLVMLIIVNRCLIAFCKTKEFYIAHQYKQQQQQQIALSSSSSKWLQRLDPFRLVGISIQSGALLGSLLMKLLTMLSILKQ